MEHLDRDPRGNWMQIWELRREPEAAAVQVKFPEESRENEKQESF